MTGLAVGHIGQAEVKAVLAFLSDVRDVDVDQAIPPGLVARVDGLIPGAHVVYRENDLLRRRTPRMIDASGTAVDEDDMLYWAVGPCPITEYRQRTGDLSAARLSDVISWRRYRETALYREYFQPGGIDHMLDLGLEVGADRQRTLLLCRERGDPDFSERDRAVLELLRPHLRAREARADLYARMAATRHGETDPDAAEVELTPREREVVLLAAAGRTNAQIAAELWVSPATVKKHLENVYLKLGVHGRAAAATTVIQARIRGG